MSLDISKVIKGENVKFKNPPKAFLEAVGGVDGMQELMYRFYDKIYESEISHFFPQDEDEFEKIKIRNSKFFIQICGGPKIYEDDKEGQDMDEYMVRLHDDFSINEKARIEWLGTMREAIEEHKIEDKEAVKAFWDYLDSFSKLTVNTFNDGSTYYASLLDKSDSRLGN